MWLSVDTIELDTEWTYTAPATGTWFRVQHLIIGGTAFRRGYIAQASSFAPVELHNIKRMYSKQEYDVFQLIKPDPWEERSLAVREYFPSRAGESWTVRIDVWQGTQETIDSIEKLAEQIALIKSLIQLLL